MNFILGVFATVVVGLLARYWFNQRAHTQAAVLCREVFAVWAAQGPFEDGEASSRAMRRANVAVRGVDSIKDADMLLTLEKHRLVYDNDTQEWEILRNSALENAKGEKFEEQFSTALLLSGIDGDAPHNSIDLTSLSPEERLQKDKETGQSIAQAVGEKIMTTETEAAKELTDFLMDFYKAECQVYPQTPTELGMAWCWAIAFKDDHPDKPLSVKFVSLNDNWNASKEE